MAPLKNQINRKKLILLWIEHILVYSQENPIDSQLFEYQHNYYSVGSQLVSFKSGFNNVSL